MAYQQRRPVVIDLMSDDDDQPAVPAAQPMPQYQQPTVPAVPPPDDQVNAGLGFDDALENLIPEDFPYHEFAQPPPADPPRQDNEDGEYIIIDGEAVFIPNSPPRVAPSPPQANRDSSEHFVDAPEMPEEVFTVDTCLQRVLAIFPDISHEHVQKLYNDFDGRDGFEAFSGRSRFENIIDKLASGEDYPKQGRGSRAQKRKREDDDEDDAKRWQDANRQLLPPVGKSSVSHILKADFPDVPKSNISRLLNDHKHLYQTYIAVANERDTSQREWRGRASMRNLADADTIANNSGIADLGEELRAARKKVQTIRAQRASDEAQKRVEEENLRLAMEAGETAECQACFEDLPMNRQIHCNGAIAHFTCFDCATTYVKTQVGESRCRVLCTAGCGAGFAHAQLHLLSDKKLLEKLEQLQQEQDIRDAGLDDLEECPFCDYKAIMPPIEENFEFRCDNPECEKVSCRRCKAISHIPLSCEEHAKDNKLNTRHKIEEAMTAAMIRSCNKCKKQFIKDYGCNKMSCPSCGNMQCYVCSETLKDYNHFDQGPGHTGRTVGGGQPKKCPLYDNVEERHEREVKEAEAAARAKAMEDNPDVSEQDLEIKVSDAVKKAAQDRVRRAGAMPGAAPAAYGGLFMGAALDEFFGDLDADEDEDGDEEVPARNRRLVQQRNARQAAQMLAIQRRLGHGPDAFANRRLAHRAPRLAAQNVQPVPPPPLRAPPLQPVGVIPVYGLQPPAAPQAAAPPALAQPAPAAGGGRRQRNDDMNEWFDGFFGGDADANRFAQPMHDPPAPAIGHARDPRLPAPNNAAGGGAVLEERRMTARLHQQAQLLQIRQQQAARMAAHDQQARAFDQLRQQFAAPARQAQAQQQADQLWQDLGFDRQRAVNGNAQNVPLPVPRAGPRAVPRQYQPQWYEGPPP